MKFTKLEIWRHNGFLGSTAMARQAMIAIQNSMTASTLSKQLAFEIERTLLDLATSLKKRVDQ